MKNIDFTGKKVLITGGSKGMGFCIAKQFYNLGGAIVITATQKDHFSQDFIKKERVEFFEVDFLKEKSMKTFTEYLMEEKIDVLVNNAGIYQPQQLGNIDLEIWDKIMKINLSAPMIISNTIAKGMRNRKSGKIVNISSIAGVISRQGSAAYSSSKAGLIGFTRACALDMAEDNVLVNAVCPGTTQTEMVENILSQDQKQNIINNIPLKRLGKPSEVADLVIFLCSDLNTYMTGQTLVIDGGYVIQ